MTQKSEKIAEEEAKCQHIADLAQQELDEAIPALEEAMRVCFYNFPYLFVDYVNVDIPVVIL